MHELEALLTAQQLADYLGVPVTTLYQWRHRREGSPSFRAERHLRYRWRDVEEWIEYQLQDVSRCGHVSVDPDVWERQATVGRSRASSSSEPSCGHGFGPEPRRPSPRTSTSSRWRQTTTFEGRSGMDS